MHARLGLLTAARRRRARIPPRRGATRPQSLVDDSSFAGNIAMAMPLLGAEALSNASRVVPE